MTDRVGSELLGFMEKFSPNRFGDAILFFAPEILPPFPLKTNTCSNRYSNRCSNRDYWFVCLCVCLFVPTPTVREGFEARFGAVFDRMLWARIRACARQTQP